MKNTLPIVYNGGAYGTYLEWLLNTLIDDQDIQPPFVTTGRGAGTSHHSQLGHELVSLPKWRDYVSSSSEHLTVRLHPKTSRLEKVSDNLEEILENCNKMILIYPDRDSELLCINRFISKPWSTDCLFDGPLGMTDRHVLTDRWPVDPNQSVEEIPRWIIREYLSFYLVPAWRDQVDWFLPDTWHNPRCLVVYVNQLLYDVKNTLSRIQIFWQREFAKDIDMILPYHDQQLALQHDMDQDAVCRKIMQSIFNTQDFFSWQCLPLASESWIQWKLRSMGLEMYCDGLDVFPTDNVTLAKLLYQK